MAVDIGDTYRISYTQKDANGGLINSDTMTLTIVLPDGTSSTPTTIAATTTGVYKSDYVTTQAGRHLAHWVGIGTYNGAHLDTFDVRPADAPYIVSLADVKAQTNISNDTNDDELRPYVEAATGVIERHLGQAIVRRTRTEDYWVPGLQLVLNWAPVLSLTSVVAVDGSTTWDVSKLHVSANSGVVTAMSGTALSGFVTVTYVTGMQIIPAEYGRAACVIVQHLWETQRGSKGGPRVGGMDDTLGFQQAGYAIPNRALELLGTGLPGVA